MHKLSVRVYYEDTDFGGVVYYANYLKFIERGRTEALRDAGIDQVALKNDGLVFVVRRLTADYLSPARFDDVLTVDTRVSWMKRASLGMAQSITRGSDILFTADVTIACMNTEGRPARLPTELSRSFVDIVQTS
jgi:acyl-CoA thioester hydrolase